MIIADGLLSISIRIIGNSSAIGDTNKMNRFEYQRGKVKQLERKILDAKSSKSLDSKCKDKKKK